MNSQGILIPLFSLLLILIKSLILVSSNPLWYQTCGKSYNCGPITGIQYPFIGNGDPQYCGYPGLELNCNQDNITIQIKNMEYRVLEIDQTTQTMRIAREDVMESVCPHDLVNTTLDYNLFDYASNYTNLTFIYGCPTSIGLPGFVSCGSASNNGVYVLPGSVGPGNCNTSVVVPVLQTGSVGSVNMTGLDQALRTGFDVRWIVDRRACRDCTQSGGRCGYDYIKNQTTCFCADPPYMTDTCPGGNGAPRLSDSGSSRNEIGVGFSISGGLVIMIILVIIFYYRRRRFKAGKNKEMDDKNDEMDDKNVEAFLRNHGSLAPKRFTYFDIKKMTNSFADKLGEGGYGSVFKGKLLDGRLVAVKLLSVTNSDGGDFVNEVASISRTSHVNIVTLLGFCLERNKRALVYEFMPNKSLDKFIGKNVSSSLDWETLYQIAVGTARGLEYLHRGCNTRIVHFDIKPENILLDEEFCPKISDFGLAKLCKRKNSVVSMMGARGTPGYIAPEVFCRHFGEVSHKSDVYSYGMTVINMVGVGKNTEVGLGLDSTSGTYFPGYIYKRIELGEDLRGLQGEMSEEGEETARKMVLVSLWCIQTNASDRPSMSKVVEMLEGSIELIQVPPKPFLFSPVRANQDSCSVLSTSDEIQLMESNSAIEPKAN